jgi:hypothetical protein
MTGERWAVEVPNFGESTQVVDFPRLEGDKWYSPPSHKDTKLD